MPNHWNAKTHTPLEISQEGLIVVRRSAADADDAMGAVRYVEYAHDGAPLLVLRAPDAHTVPTIREYLELCGQFSLRGQRDRALGHMTRFVDWQEANAKLTHLPDPLPTNRLTGSQEPAKL